MKVKKVPARKCLISNESFPKEELFRVVRTPEGKVILDMTYKANGRGAYIKKDEEIINRAKSKKVLDKALETKVDDEVYERMMIFLKMK